LSDEINPVQWKRTCRFFSS